MELQGNVAVVTGAASGIGLALAARFIREGARVVVSDVDAEAGSAAARALGARFVQADVSLEADIRALITDVVDQEGHIDLFCSNAGIGLFMDAEATEADWTRVLNVNLMSHVWAARHVLPHMLARGGGYLLNTASAAGLLNEVGSVGYATTKHAAVGFAEWLAFSYAERGIKVSVLCPEGVRTPMIAALPYLQRTAITPEEVAETVVAALREERFMIATHETTLPAFQSKAADYEGYIRFMTARRAQALELAQGLGEEP